MSINYEGLRSLTARELTAALDCDGFYFIRQIDRTSVIAIRMDAA
jgi:hypothetical protein